MDAGATWVPVTDLIPTDYIDTLAMSPTDPNTIYAGTGETYSGDGRRGLGILKTTDAGANWTRLPATANSNYYYVNKIVITPGGNIYAATNTGVYRSLRTPDLTEFELTQLYTPVEGPYPEKEFPWP
jgi:photosystem II stability/assembly factor-like uncharacterized protein